MFIGNPSLASRCALLLALCFAFALPAFAAPAKIGVISTADPRWADLLTAELSSIPNVTLLERAGLQEIFREQTRSASLAETARLAGADALVVLEAVPLTGGASLSLRLFSVRHGILLGWWPYEARNDTAPDWAASAAADLRTVLGKVSQPADRLAPISFVGFTAPTSSRSSALLQRELNTLLLQSLSAQPGLVVLERQKLQDASFETFLAGEDRQFWSGAFLVEGTINRDQIDNRQVSLHARLLDASGQVAAETALAGPRTNLTALATRFVDWVRASTKPGAPAAAWDSREEAARFLAEAERAVRARFWDEAAAAADAAAALGRHDAALQKTRLAAYSGTLEEVFNRQGAWRFVKPRYGIIETYGAAPTLSEMHRAQGLAEQLVTLARSPDLFAPEGLLPEFQRALEALGSFTLQLYFGAELREPFPGATEDLRATARAAATATLDHPVVAHWYFPNTAVRTSTAEEQKRLNAVLDTVAIILKFGPLWEDTPESALTLHRSLRSTLRFRLLEGRRKKPFEWVPALPGWTWQDRQNADSLWAGFEHELAQKRSAPKLAGAPSPTPTSPFDSAAALHASALQAATSRVDPVASLQAPEQLQTIAVTNVLPLRTSLRIGAPDAKAALAARSFRLPGPERAGYQMLAAVTEGSEVWLLYLTTHSQVVRAGTRTPAFNREVHLSRFNVAEGNSTTRKLPAHFFADLSFQGRAQMAVFPDRVILAIGSRLVAGRWESDEFTAMEAPLSQPRLLRHGGDLFLYNEESILQTTPDLQSFQVLASVRRRPAETPLDEFPHWTGVQMVRTDGNVHLLATNLLFALRDGQWEQLTPEPGTRAIHPSGEAFILQERIPIPGNQARHRGTFFGPAGEPVVWWNGLELPGPPPFTMRHQLKRDDASARYQELPISESFFPVQGGFSSGQSAQILTHDQELFTVAFPQRKPAQVIFWQPRHWQPFTVTVELPDPPQRITPIHPMMLLKAGPHIVMAGREETNLWLLDGRALVGSFRDFQARQEERIRQANDYLDSRLARFDQNTNEQLDPAEYAALAHEPAFFNLAWAQLDSDHDNILRARELAGFDFDRDRQLSPGEHQAFLNAISFAAAGFYRAFDANADGGLSAAEMQPIIQMSDRIVAALERHGLKRHENLGLPGFTALWAERQHRYLKEAEAKSSCLDQLPPSTHLLDRAWLNCLLQSQPAP